MKRIIAIALSLLMIISVTACRKPGSSNQGNIGMGAGGGCDAGLGGMSLGLVGIFVAARKGKKH